MWDSAPSGRLLSSFRVILSLCNIELLFLRLVLFRF
uniref:Uncharacterized protein n=1 Tax=Anguilla anguilla TaxID=7936 RepID=A0A0E9VKT4_ANGAN